MICLKTRTFAVSPTTEGLINSQAIKLWFAWKLVHLQYRQQHLPIRRFHKYSCDLLENSYICSIANNIGLTCTHRNRLWFAWKLVHLQYRQQLTTLISRSKPCCDLLENSYICSIANNHFICESCLDVVVICLKTRTFAVSPTTYVLNKIYELSLWFAWKLVHLQYRQQQEVNNRVDNVSCDLLENSYICSIANNRLYSMRLGHIVVICLKTRTFAVSPTTRARCY